MQILYFLYYNVFRILQLFPESGITVFAALPHTHLQGRIKNCADAINAFFCLKGHSVWTKIIRNQKAVGYLFNAESYDFNYQFANTFSKPIQLYPV
jgi:hypothetical protein